MRDEIIPYDGSIEAQYADGYIHSETELDDTSPYLPDTANVLNDILEKRPEAEHGRLVRVSCFYLNRRYDIDFTELPDNARPIRFKHMERDMTSDGSFVSEVRMTGIDFGYQYTDEEGKNIQQVEVL